MIFKIGVLGCAPLDMPERLADEYDADFVSSDLIRAELMEEDERAGGAKSPPRDIDTRRIKDILMARAGETLAEGRDVVLDMFFNTTNSRRLPLSLARKTGAVTLALWINTPFSVAMGRVQQWTEEDAFVVPVSKWSIPPTKAAKAMMGHVVWPSHEGIDYVFNLQGSNDTSGILDQFEAELESSGLSDRYE
jgi:predicted kinase